VGTQSISATLLNCQATDLLHALGRADTHESQDPG